MALVISWLMSGFVVGQFFFNMWLVSTPSPAVTCHAKSWQKCTLRPRDYNSFAMKISSQNHREINITESISAS